MAQLSDDCFAFGGPLMTIEDAHALFGERLVAVVGTEDVPVSDADGRILAEDCVAPIDVPPFPNSAVDGYAVRFADLRASDATVLTVGAVVTAGGSSEGVSVAGSAARIFTGAPMPSEADTVFMQEDVQVLPDGRVSLPLGLKRGANSRDAGEDVAKGSSIVPAGRRLRPQDLALATAVGLRTVKVRRPLRVGVFSTGNELVEPGTPLRPGAIYDSNRILLLALLRRMGVAVRDLGVIRDDPAAVAARLSAAAAEHDVILTSGGVSTGDEDHVKTAVETIGRLVFWRLGIKPGRPVAMGMIDGKPFLGLPGNPVAVYVTLLFVVRPLLARLAGEAYAPPPGFTVRAAFSYRKRAGRREFVRVSLARDADGTWEAWKFQRDGAGMLSSLTETDGLVELEDGRTEVVPGDVVRFHPHGALW
ncbi:molybdopterin molybdotransferase MoeA [Methylobacterium mesophilicum SR1.6/6]|uniref:Molybdopterin molybdenumtransferase n=1 Tax=Methylobacterium mesophilicum SR1.6/6 TaxID=908290 RepID=A0A6B9FUQ6_9HYPH|nr:gephyrin-like molybdotransferase Glp [Methylobacterium mesophilicum]QGY05609.1 molybdopterin molybdotransferase MoeA [Methylobacterium mesophilicum SR1.6/6]